MLSTYTVPRVPEMMSWARWPRVVMLANSLRGTSMLTHSLDWSVGAKKESSCSTSSPPDHAPSAPKSTSFTLNTCPPSVAPGVQMSMWKWVISRASMVCDTNSMPAKTRLV